ncbi:N-acetylmuramoyl-L-alanine amidase [Profundibacter sp.]|uniref:N-acetylmuramoyl-L-alanine amidase n=1 Tax=Profundibacter sp. TaxID=3101071 RepID=UPI003D0D93CE
MVVLHYTAMDSATAALERLSAPEAEVSAHYLISETGEVFSLVPEEKRAWHAGAGQWGAVTDVNSRSIGIEIANTGFAPFPEPQMVALEGLLQDIMRRWAIQPERIIGHSDMAPGRKIDPGRRFDWRRLALGGLSVWPNPVSKPFDKTGLVDMLHAFGMTAENDAEILLKAFRLRFRPWASGPLDDLDLAMANDLATRYPVDQLPLTS